MHLQYETLTPLMISNNVTGTTWCFRCIAWSDKSLFFPL